MGKTSTARSGAGGVSRQPAGLLRKRGREPGDDESPAADLLNDDLQHPEPFFRKQVRALAGVHVHGHPANALANQPVNVASERLLVDRQVASHWRHDCRDQAVQVRPLHALLLSRDRLVPRVARP
jgi:hypothetical protein